MEGLSALPPVDQFDATDLDNAMTALPIEPGCLRVEYYLSHSDTLSLLNEVSTLKWSNEP